jgi:hypothetical protein
MRNTLGWFAALAMVLVPCTLAAQNKDHNDAFVRGPQGENRLMQQIRHQLVMLPYYDRSLSEAARRKEPSKAVGVGSGRFGPSRKKEAAARRFGSYELWVFECRADPGSVDQRQDATGVARLIEGSGMS